MTQHNSQENTSSEKTLYRKIISDIAKLPKSPAARMFIIGIFETFKNSKSLTELAKNEEELKIIRKELDIFLESYNQLFSKATSEQTAEFMLDTIITKIAYFSFSLFDKMENSSVPILIFNYLKRKELIKAENLPENPENFKKIIIDSINMFDEEYEENIRPKIKSISKAKNYAIMANIRLKKIVSDPIWVEYCTKNKNLYKEFLQEPDSVSKAIYLFTKGAKYFSLLKKAVKRSYHNFRYGYVPVEKTTTHRVLSSLLYPVTAISSVIGSLKLNYNSFAKYAPVFAIPVTAGIEFFSTNKEDRNIFKNLFEKTVHFLVCSSVASLAVFATPLLAIAGSLAPLFLTIGVSSGVNFLLEKYHVIDSAYNSVTELSTVAYNKLFNINSEFPKEAEGSQEATTSHTVNLSSNNNQPSVSV